MEQLIVALRAVAEPTRLRILAVLARGERTVSELTQILGQSQPRVSRHLKLLVDAGLLERHPEGAWVFYRSCDRGVTGELRRTVLALLPAEDAQHRGDLERLEAIRGRHAEEAASWFQRHAEQWDRLREMHVGEAEVEVAVRSALDGFEADLHVDLGTGTGRMLELLATQARAAVGIDFSREMLRVARTRLERAQFAHCQVRHGDIQRLPLADGCADLVTIHHVLHFLDEPAAALREAARLLRRDGRLIIVDFAPHHLESLRSEFAHRRLGFADAEMRQWLQGCGLAAIQVQHLRDRGRPDALTVSVWSAVQQRAHDTDTTPRLAVA